MQKRTTTALLLVALMAAAAGIAAGGFLRLFGWTLILFMIIGGGMQYFYNKAGEEVEQTKKELEEKKEEYRHKTSPAPITPKIEEHRKYRPKPIYTPVPAPSTHETRHGIFESLEREHKRMSGEEVFERLKKHTG